MLLGGKPRSKIGHWTTEDAIAAFADMADDRIVADAAKMVENGLARWVPDPQVQGTFGLILNGDPNRAVVLIYSDDLPWMRRNEWDFEMDDLRWDGLVEEMQ